MKHIINWTAAGATEFEINVLKFRDAQGNKLPYEHAYVDDSGNPLIDSNDANAALAIKLMLEELLETADAMGVSIMIEDSKIDLASFKDGSINVTQQHNKPIKIDEVVDGLADLYYTTVWSALEFGIPLQQYADIVAMSNNTKFGNGWYKNEDGKVIKSPEYTPADKIIKATLTFNIKLA